MSIGQNSTTRLFTVMAATLALALLGVVLAGFNANSAPGNTPHQFDSPVRLASGASGSTLVVSDLNARQVHFLNRNNLASKTSIDLAGRPSGIAQWKKQVVIGNQENGSVCVYSNSGVLSHCLGIGAGEFEQPNDLAIDTSGLIVYVLDTIAKRVMLYDLASGTLAGTNVGLGHLVQPTALALSPTTGDLYVSDFGDSSTLPQIQVFTPDGNYDRSILGGREIFSTPQGLHVDDNGRIFLADAVSGEIVIFNASGILLGTLGGLGTAEGQLFYPLDVFVDHRSRNVYVADNRNHRITVFPNGGVLP